MLCLIALFSPLSPRRKCGSKAALATFPPPLEPVLLAIFAYRFLLVAQVVLALQLPFVLVPLIKATSSKKLMGPHRNSTLLAAAAWASCGLVFTANLGLFVSELWPGCLLYTSRRG